MLTYKDLTKYFGSFLIDKNFQTFLFNNFTDLTEYDILESSYIISELTGIELGFINNDAVYDEDDAVIFEKGNPIFSYFNLYPKSKILISSFPFDISFSDKRESVFIKAGHPLKTNQGHADFLNKDFLVDSYKEADTVIAFDYDNNNKTINHIAVRDNNLVEHLKL